MSSSRRTNYYNSNSRHNNDRNIYNADSDESDDDPGMSNNNYRRRPQATIPSDLSKQLLKSYCHPAAQQQEEEDDLLGFGNRTPKATKPKRIPNDTADAVSELLRMFVVEAHSRAKLEVSFIRTVLGLLVYASNARQKKKFNYYRINIVL